MSQSSSEAGDRLGLLGVVLTIAIRDGDTRLRAVALRELGRVVLLLSRDSGSAESE